MEGKVEEFLSLYDFLGRAAGSELGKTVAAVAMERNVPIENKVVVTATYCGTILKYPLSFLNEYFNTNLK